jgi:hypothetical protein
VFHLRSSTYQLRVWLLRRRGYPVRSSFDPDLPCCGPATLCGPNIGATGTSLWLTKAISALTQPSAQLSTQARRSGTKICLRASLPTKYKH